MSTITKDLGMVTAFAYAVSKGYTGTEDEFAELMASYADVAEQAAESAAQAGASATAAEQAKAEAVLSASTAASSASTASTKASEAASSASSAAGSANTATTKANEASASATNAASSASAAATSATNAGASATAAASSATAASNAQTAAETAQGAAEDAQAAAEAAAQSVSQSAAQIAQNTTDITDLKADQYKAYATDTASGSIASFPDGADDIPVKDLSVDIEPVQSGSGDPSPDNIRPISGWTGAKVALAGKNLLRLVGSEMVASGWNRRFPFFIKAGTYTISCQNQFGAADDKLGVRLNWTDKNGTAIKDVFTSYEFGNATMQSGITFTESMAEQIAYIEIRPRATGMTFQQIADAQIMLELGSTATDYEPYDGDTYSIAFPTAAGTVYGGTLDVTTGKLTVDSAMVDLGTLTWNKGNTSSERWWFSATRADAKKAPSNNQKANCICSSYEIKTPNNLWGGHLGAGVNASSPQIIVADLSYEDANTFKTAMSGVQFVYELDTPIVYDLTPTEVTTLLGTNNIWADCGDSTVEYRADTKLYIDKKIAALAAAMN